MDNNYPFDSVAWSATQSPGMPLSLPLLGSPSFPSAFSGSNSADSLLQPPSWQLDHAPSWDPDSTIASAFSASFLSPLPLANPPLGPAPHSSTSEQEGLAGPVDDFSGSFLTLLGSPAGGMEQPLRLTEDDDEEAELDVDVEGDGEGEGQVEVEAEGDESASGSSSEDDSDDEEEEQPSSLAVTEAPLPPAAFDLNPLSDIGGASSAYAEAYALAQQAVNSTYPYASASDHSAYPDSYSLVRSTAAGLVGEEHDDGSVSSPRYHGSGDEETPPTSNSSDHDLGRSPYPHGYQAGGGAGYDLKSSTYSGAGAPSHYFYPSPLDPSHSIAVSPASLQEEEDDKPFIPALSRPRSAHLRQSYANEEREIDRLLADADPDFDFANEELLSSAGSKKRKRSASAAVHAAQVGGGGMAWAPPPLAFSGGSAAPPSSSRRSTSTEAHDAMSIASGSGSIVSHAGSSTSTSKGKKGKGKKGSAAAASASAYNDALAASAAASGAARKRTEIPAVEDDPSIRPYGCNYDYCSSRARVEAKGGPSALPVGVNGELLDERDAISWRTVRELREHCAEHRRAGLDGGQLPFRCALDPCGKTFKSLAGLRFHFQNASANGHFFVSHEEGEAAPSKKFKACVQPTERSEKCPVPGCSKAFKQAAGLAYHLAHTAGHDMTEELVSTFAATLQSKTRWWYAKMGRALG